MGENLHSVHFTVDEARGQLTEIHALASKMVELKKSLTGSGWDVRKHAYFGGMGPNGDGSFPQEMETLVAIVRQLNQRGIMVKDLDIGLLDFPHVRASGEEVYLCWRLGEDDVLFWHGTGEGFAGRRPIEEL